ncbi:sigma-54-dependent transcriptional regulator [Negadavirga shengliensis]|uniref:Sigma-54-dependent transcriptional regulator n=1 Tax=Negadavirga shengliensis TaxID=1389218 RepID=A0ABV9T356_9BACT
MKEILIIDKEKSSALALEKLLVNNHYTVTMTSTAKDALRLIENKFFHVILCDTRLNDIPEHDLLEQTLHIRPGSVVIFISRYVNLRLAVDLVKKGAYQYMEKPLNPNELLEVLSKSLMEKETKPSDSAPRQKKSNNRSFHSTDYLTGNSAEAKKMMSQVKKVGSTNFTVIIQGETGTGKESLARMIHDESPRRNKPFMAIDCGCLSKDLAASELFGHEKGAFTGAFSNKTGVFEMADGGTVFLDEIANLSLETQMALLRSLQEKVIRKIGGVKEIPVDVRIITATNEDLFLKSNKGYFREDLYFRLSEFILPVPPLRERKVDLPLFINFFLEKTAEELGVATPTLSEEVTAYLRDYPWPGNIRELKNVIRRACLFISDDNYIYINGLPENVIKYVDNTLQTRAAAVEELPEAPEEEAPDNMALKTAALQAETKKIMEVLQEVHFNKTKAAQKLKINRKTLYTKLKMLNIPY